MSDFVTNYVLVPFNNIDVGLNIIGNAIFLMAIAGFLVYFLNPMYTKWTIDKYNTISAYIVYPQVFVLFGLLLFWYFALPILIIFVYFCGKHINKEQHMFLELEKIGIFPSVAKEAENDLQIYKMRKDELSKMELNRKIIKPKLIYIILITAIEFSLILLYLYSNDCKYLLIPLQKF